MNIELKFRAWDAHFEEMCYVTSMFFPPKKKNGFDIVEGHGVSGSPYRDITITELNPLMLYSGEKDIEGNEIYTGDILYSRYEDDEEEKGYGEVWNEVVFSAGAFGWKGETTGEAHPFCIEPLHLSSKVVGNIYQNPQLLTNGQRAAH